MSVPGRSRRTYLRADDRRAQILNVAKGVFSRRGYHGANVAHICQAAKIGRGTLYQYFDNKRAVLLALLEDVEARVKKVLETRPKVQGVVAARLSYDTVREFCRGRLREMLDAIFVDEATLRLVFRDARGLDGAVDRVIARIDAMCLQTMEQDLLAAQRGGVFREGDRKLIARYLLGGMEKILLSALAADEPLDLDAVVDLAVEIQLFGLLTKEVRG